jgi:hypothetical protein
MVAPFAPFSSYYLSAAELQPKWEQSFNHENMKREKIFKADRFSNAFFVLRIFRAIVSFQHGVLESELTWMSPDASL